MTKDIFEFINSLFSSISWPIASIVIVSLLKKPIKNILNRLGKLKYKDLEADFSREMEEAKEHLDSKLEAMPLESDFKHTLAEQVAEIAEISPEAAIPFAYSQIENALREKIKDMENYVNKNIFLINNISKYLYNNEKIDKKTFEILNMMRKLRNEISHNNINNIFISKNDAVEYGKNAEILINIINEIK
jgi:Rad3-related DNA helicase